MVNWIINEWGSYTCVISKFMLDIVNIETLQHLLLVEYFGCSTCGIGIRYYRYELVLCNLYSSIGYRSRFWLSWLGTLVYCFQTLLNCLAFQYFDFECTWWKLFQKRVVRTKFDIYVFIQSFNQSSARMMPSLHIMIFCWKRWTTVT